ncbi:feruloyl-CoA synthase [Pseudorhodoplanes sinuspersici]|uniref:Feruloyl-CoA synthase n=1 Tax=Pseudorhodoplanes sinuspersici TaxID=1235591 RepID=A0A1W6ZNJ0_9HYPH|nr:feruloyl-CoA synthase [Pseudorhodoplanes sinuspersici]ARP98710.1 feruloyl-CoA synthase [Pseudorhodoplanes sinuspersici]RKE69689.1 4-coumarate--CoA ligase [Pseudorhodoplanes sinuspersici]
MADALRQADPASAAPYRKVRLEQPDLEVTHRADGSILLKPLQPLGPYPDRLTDRLVYWAQKTPDVTLFAGRDADGGWRRISYAQALNTARSIGEALLDRNLSAERPVVILSGNDLEHAMIGLACLYAGIAYAPISPAYSLVSTDFGKLKHIFNLLTPGLVFASDGQAFARAIETVVPQDVELVVTRNAPSSRPALTFEQLAKTPPTPRIDEAHLSVGPGTIAKFLFTSGSTGQPKGVINTQRMMCSNQVAMVSRLACFQDEPPVTLDWAPWHHTAGGNHDVGLILYNGGTFYIDEGKPLPGAIDITVRNLKEVAPTFYFNVPKGFEALLPFLRSDAQLRQNFFSRLKVLWFAGAALSQPVFDEMQDLALQTIGERIHFLTGFGSTETAPGVFARTQPAANSTNMGVLVPGSDLKLVPVDGKLEARVKGPNITPGYWRQPDLTAKAFDEEGFYKLGDAFKFDDPSDPSKGLLFDGRVAEDFKLATGTWVSVGPLRAKLIDALAPYVRDVVIAGADRDDIRILVFPNIDACRQLAGLPQDAPLEDVLTHDNVRQQLQSVLSDLAKKSTGSSNRVCRALLMSEPPSLDAGEMTDKGSINQRAVLTRRARLVEELYGPVSAPHIIDVTTGQ